MNNNGYWSSVLGRRLSRRRALAASGAGLSAAALLAACGGNDAADDTSSGVFTKVVDTSKEAKRGGTMKTAYDGSISDYNVHFTRSGGQGIPNLTYSRFLQIKPGYMEPTKWDVTGDGAESWEWSPDGLTLTMKLRQNWNWAPLAPVNGRPVTMDDIAFTWKLYTTSGSNRGDYLNSLDPDSPILDLQFPDQRTMVWKLAFPMVGLLGMMASNIKQSYFIPMEAESKYDLRTTPIGSGPYYITNYQPDVGWTMKRNPGFYDKEHPYIDTIERPIIPEYAAALAQFRTGAMYDFALRGLMRGEDVLPTKRDIPQLNMYAIDVPASRNVFFGWKPNPPEKTPFRDERVRQALSMSIDRPLYFDVINNVNKFEAEGIPMKVRWITAVEPEYEGWWLDPEGKDFGPNAQYYMHNIAEAKKLLSAAGFPNGIDVDSNRPGAGYSDLAETTREADVIEGMAAEAGFRYTINMIPYNNEFVPKYRDGRGNFEGMSYSAGGIAGSDAVERLWKQFSAGSTNILFTGFDPDGKGTFAGDPTLEALLRRGRGEQDSAKRQGIVHEAQRYLAKKLYTMRTGGLVSGFELLWPCVRNQGTYQGGQIFYYNTWIDETKEPISKA